MNVEKNFDVGTKSPNKKQIIAGLKIQANDNSQQPQTQDKRFYYEF